MTRQFHRPARLDPEVAESIEGAADTASSSELAHRAAQALLGGRSLPDDSHGSYDDGASDDPGEWITRPGVVAAVAAHGVDAVAELWADSPATTLPGALWRLFLVREWIRRDPALIARRYATVVDLSGAGDTTLSRFEAARAERVRSPRPRICAPPWTGSSPGSWMTSSPWRRSSGSPPHSCGRSRPARTRCGSSTTPMSSPTASPAGTPRSWRPPTSWPRPRAGPPPAVSTDRRRFRLLLLSVPVGAFRSGSATYEIRPPTASSWRLRRGTMPS